MVGPEIEPEQGRHLAVLGETGMGKSSLLLSIARRVAHGSGLVLLDPLGDTVRALRDELSPALTRRLTWVDPASPIGLNALEGVGDSTLHGEAHRERQLSALVQSLRRVRSGRYVDSGFWGPRLEEMLTRALRAAASFPGGTLVDAHALLASGARGFRTIPPEATEAVRDLSDRIRSRPDDAEGARRLLYEIVRSPILVRSLCDRSPSIRASDLVAPGRLVLIAGDAASIGESTARYLLSVHLALLWSELLSRPRAGKTFVVLDEAQWFVHESLAEMLRLGRRRNVHVVLATQSIASLPEPVAEAVWTNVSDFVAFRGSPDEAREFSRAARGISPEAVLSLPRGEAAVLLGKGNAVHWIRTARFPAIGSVPSAAPPATAAGDVAGGRAPGTAMAAGDGLRPIARDPRDERGAVLAAIARRVARSGAGPPVRISLRELRQESDPGGRGVRAAGGLLGRAGAIVRTGRDESGPCWWVDPRRIASLDALDPPTTGTADSDLSQHS